MCLYFSVGSPLGATVVITLQASASRKSFRHFLNTRAKAVLIITGGTCAYNCRLISLCSSPTFTCTWQPTQGWEAHMHSFSLLNDFTAYNVPPFVLLLDFWIQAHQQDPKMAWFTLEKSKMKERKNRVGVGTNKGGGREGFWNRYQQH